MPQLQEEGAARLVHRVDDGLPGSDLLRAVDARRIGVPVRMCQPDSALNLLLSVKKTLCWPHPWPVGEMQVASVSNSPPLTVLWL